MKSAKIHWSQFAGNAAYLDTNIIIYAVETGNRWSEILRELFAAIDENAIHAVTSELSLAEVLAKPIQIGASRLVQTYEAVLRPNGAISVVPVDRAIIRSAAALRAKLGIKLMDAIHLATAKQHSCDVFLTNDTRLGRRIDAEIRCVHLWDLAGEVCADQ